MMITVVVFCHILAKCFYTHAFIYLCHLALSTSYVDEKKIKTKILNGYDISTRPSVGNRPVKVDFGMKIQKIVKFVSKRM